MLLLVPLALLFEKSDTLGTQNGRDGHIGGADGDTVARKAQSIAWFESKNVALPWNDQFQGGASVFIVRK